VGVYGRPRPIGSLCVRDDIEIEAVLVTATRYASDPGPFGIAEAAGAGLSGILDSSKLRQDALMSKAAAAATFGLLLGKL
jgi:hypothetical protein